MARIRAGILNSQKIPEPIDPDLKIYGVDGLPTKSEHMPNLNIVRTDDAVGMTPADFHNVFPFNEIVNENVPTFVEYGQWDANYNTFEDKSQMVYELSKADNVFYEHSFINKIPSSEMLGIATSATIYVKDPNNRYNYVVASGTKYGNPINFENCVYHMDNMNAYLQKMMEGMDTSYTYPVVRYGTFFIAAHMTAVTGYIYHNGTNWIRMSETAHYLQPLDETIPKQEITTSSVFKTLDDNKYWRYNGGTSYTIADFDEIPIPLTPTKRIPKFYVKRGMNPDGTWFEKISKTKHDETWLCHKAFISDDEIEKPYIYVASEIVTSTYRDLREDRGNFKVYGETEYDMFETLFRIAYASWMSTYDEDDFLVIADLREFGIEYLDCVLRVETSYDEITGDTDIDGVGFGRPFATHNGMAIRVSDISSFRNVKGQSVDGLRVPEDAPADGAMYHFNEIEINSNDIFKYVDIVSEYDDPNPVIRQSINIDVGPDAGVVPNSYQALSNDVVIVPGSVGSNYEDYEEHAFNIFNIAGHESLFPDAWQDMKDSETVLFDIPLALVAPNQEMGGFTIDLYVGTNDQLQALYDACANETITPNDVYYVNNVATYYVGDISGGVGFPIPLYSFGDFGPNDNTSFVIGDLTPLSMGLGLVLAKVAGVSIPNNNIVIQQGFEFENESGIIIPDSVTSIGYASFENWSANNQPLVIPNSVTSIGSYAFSNWKANNQPLVIPDSITSVGEYAFWNWQENNQPLVIPDSVTSIGNDAFSNWYSNNQPLVIPNSVTSIGEYAFWNWTSAKEFIMESETPPTITSNSFTNTNNAPIYVPDESVDDYKTATNWVDLASRIFPMSDRDDGSIPGLESRLTLRDFEKHMRDGTFWQLTHAITQEPAFLQKQDKFNPTTMELYTYTKSNNKGWELWDSYEERQQPNDVGIGTGIISFHTIVSLLLFNAGGLRTTFLNSDFFNYNILLAPVQTRLVMLP